MSVTQSSRSLFHDVSHSRTEETIIFCEVFTHMTLECTNFKLLYHCFCTVRIEILLHAFFTRPCG